jgi:hypothetical protein
MTSLCDLASWAGTFALYQPHDFYRAEQNVRSVRQGVSGHLFAALSQLIYAAKVWLRNANPGEAI